MSKLKKITLSFLVLAMSISAWGNTLQVLSFDRLRGDSQSLLDRCVRTSKPQSIHLQAPDNTIADNSTNAYTWGTISHENGYTWYYTQTFEERGWYLGASDIIIYNNNFEQVSSLRVEVPEDMNVNDIMPVDFLTSQFFDTDAGSTELPIFIHAVDNGTQINKVHVYNLTGEKVQEYNSRSMILQTASNDYKRVLLVNEDNGAMTIDVLKPASEGVLPQVEHTFTINQDLMYYNNGPALNFYSLAGEPYYCISHFEKPCMDGFDPETYVPIQAADNYLVIKTYNKEYEMVDSLRISIAPSNPEASYGFASLGLFSYNDVRLGMFTNDNQRNYIITHYDYFAQSDEFVYNFRVYDQSGNLVNTIAENTITWFTLSNLDGFEEQYMFLKMNENAEEYMEMIDIPSCTVAAVFPSVIDDYKISTTIDRYPVENDYQYVIGLSQAVEDENGDAIARIGWYKRDCTVDHYVTFNIGKNAEGFTPYIASYVFNPYLFNTDDVREYFYLAMNKRTDGSEILDKTLYLADENGEVLRIIKPEAGDEIEFSSGDIFDYNTGEPKMVLSFYNGEKDAFEVQFFNLPFDTFTSGGDGTQENPYLITTPGELAQIKNQPAAHYSLGNDIDMNQYDMPYIAPEEFTGTFDGNNNYISNILLDGSGLFGNVSHSTIKNLHVQSPTLLIGNSHVGIIANQAQNTTIENVHIYDAHMNCSRGDNYVGGLLGKATQSDISVVSMLRACNLDIHNFGGIAGYLEESNINAAVATGDIDFSDNFGGIAAYVSQSSKISNAHTEFVLLLPIKSGGIAAVSDGVVEYCYTTGYAFGELEPESYTFHDYKNIVHTNNGTVNNCIEDVTDNLTRNNFEELGFAYGNTADAPWTGDSLPILYFENDKQSTPIVDIDNNAIRYNGSVVESTDAQRITLYNLQGVIVAASNDQALDVTNIAKGIYIAVVTDVQGNNQTRKIVVK